MNTEEPTRVKGKCTSLNDCIMTDNFNANSLISDVFDKPTQTSINDIIDLSGGSVVSNIETTIFKQMFQKMAFDAYQEETF